MRWDVERILDAATPAEIDATSEKPYGQLQTLRYRGEPYQGHDTSVFAYYACPRPADAPHPAMLLVHGGGGKAFAEWADLWGTRGYAALAMDLSGNGSDGQPLPDGGPAQDDGSKFRPFNDDTYRDTWPYQAVAAVLRGHAWLSQRPEVDPQRIGITGISWGGYLTCIVAGIDHRLAVAVPVYGCGFLAENSAWKDGGVFARMSPDNRERWVRRFDPSRYLPGVKCPILFVNGTNDFAYPLDSYRKSYRLVAAPRTLSITVNMPHSHQDGWAPREIDAFVDSVLRGAAPLPQLASPSVDGAEVTIGYEARAPIAKASLHYTTDKGPWQKRSWSTEAAGVVADQHLITARLPSARPLTWFLTATDERGLTVSTEHVELEKE